MKEIRMTFLLAACAAFGICCGALGERALPNGAMPREQPTFDLECRSDWVNVKDFGAMTFGKCKPHPNGTDLSAVADSIDDFTRLGEIDLRLCGVLKK